MEPFQHSKEVFIMEEKKFLDTILDRKPEAELAYVKRLDKALFKGNPLELEFAGIRIKGGTFQERLERSNEGVSITDFTQISEWDLLNLVEDEDEVWIYRMGDRDIVSLASHEVEGTLYLTPKHVDVRAFKKLATTKFIRL